MLNYQRVTYFGAETRLQDISRPKIDLGPWDPLPQEEKCMWGDGRRPAYCWIVWWFVMSSPWVWWYGSLDAGAASNEKGMVERRTFHLISWVVGIFQPCYTPVISICVYSNVPCFSDISHSNCWTSGFRATTSFAKICTLQPSDEGCHF